MLVSGKGTRFILANTEQLHAKIHEMSERIRVLEDSLRNTHRKYEGHIRRCPGRDNYGSHDTQGSAAEEGDDEDIPAHSLLVPELLNIKSTMGLYSGGGIGQNGSTRQETPSAKRPDVRSMEVDHPSPDSQRASSEDASTISEARPGAQVCLLEVPWAENL